MGQAVDGCQSESSCFFGSVLGCPAGDGTTLASSGGTIYITARHSNGAPYPLVPAGDFWLIGCNGGLTLCGSSASSDADSVTNQAGQTTMSGVLRVGGCDTALNVVVQGNQLFELPSCSQPQCHPIEVRSVDIDGDLNVNLVDFSRFVQGFVLAAPPPCIDFNFDGTVNLQDFSIFAQHYQHSCQYQ
jgi:hypothetical protein